MESVAVTQREKIIRAILSGITFTILFITLDLANRNYMYVLAAFFGSVATAEILLWLFKKVVRIKNEKHSKA
jgi:hypothetical protein